MKKIIDKYINEIDSVYKTHQATEATYRSILQNLLKILLPKVMIIHEPKRSAYGVPDYQLIKDGIAISFIETKNLNDKDLKGEKENINKEQFDRYKLALNTIVFTDYLTFYLFENGELTRSASIGQIIEGNVITINTAKEESAFLYIIRKLGDASPQKITQAVKLAEIMAAKAKLIASIITNALSENKTDEDHNLHHKLSAFQKILVHDMDETQFADFYAQTIVYGMFIARINDKTPKTFSRLEAAELIPSFNPFLKKIFKNIALAELHSCIAWIVDDLAEIFKISDMDRVLKNYGNETGRKDPILHFYEEFLEKYNPKIRDEFGVWYTPTPIVKFIVNAVDEVLMTELDIRGGLANNSKINIRTRNGKTKEVHRVQILDPATGTGTFLAEVCNSIYSSYIGQEGLWPEDVINHLIPRLNGFEYLMAPYTMAHLKLATALHLNEQNTNLPERLNIYLTNSLEEDQPETSLDFGVYVSDEANAANAIKRETPVMVVMGNPPYNEKSANKGDWIMKLMEDYKQEPGSQKEQVSKRGLKTIKYKNTLKEKNPKGINNDYCKFIRLGQHFVNRTEEGVLAYITANTFLDTRLFRGMRYSLLNSFDKIYIINLHGSTMRNESTTELKDQCVFDIMQGVAICIYIKSKSQCSSTLAKVFYKDIYGSRNFKLDYLSTNCLNDIDFQEIQPSPPLYIFRFSDRQLEEEYKRGFKVEDLIPNNVQGFTTDRDNVAIQYTPTGVEEVCGDLLNLAIPTDVIRTKYSVKDNRDWSLDKARNRLKNKKNWRDYITEVQYRPFDRRWTYYDKTLVTYTRPLVEQNILNRDNVVLGIGKSGNVIGDAEWSLTYISDLPMDKNIIPRGGVYQFPLYVYEDCLRITNLSPRIIQKIEKLTMLRMQDNGDTERAIGGFLPIDIMDYIYAILNSPLYRETYQDFLQSDFPIIPYPESKDYFLTIVELGKMVRELHLMKSIDVKDLITQYPISDAAKRNIVEMRLFKEEEDGLGKLYINEKQYFDKVPTDVWNAVIAGYQTLDKWIKDRTNKHLTNEEILHLQKMIVAIKRTIEIRAEIDQVIKRQMYE